MANKGIWTGKERFLRDPPKPKKPFKMPSINVLKLLKKNIGALILVLVLILIILIPKWMNKEEKITEEVEAEVEDDLSEYRNMTAEELLDAMGQRYPLKEFDIIAEKYYFEPIEIRVDVYDIVKLNFKSMDINHTVRIPAYFILEEINTENLTTIAFFAKKPGEFIFENPEHKEMRGTIVVQEKAE